MTDHTTFAKGDQIRLTVEDIAFGGDGVGRVNGMAVFVPQVCLGETVEVEIVHVAKKFARARLRAIVTPAAERVDPVCEVYGRCAGCQYQHADYAVQLSWKERQVRTLFDRIAGMPEIPLHPMVASSSPWHYRNKITLHGPDAPAFIGHDNTERVPITSCPIAHTALNQALQRWNTAHPDGLQQQQELNLRLDAEGRVYAQVGSSNQLMEQTVAGRRFTVPVASFFQVNPGIAEQMVRHVETFVSACRPEVLIDAYAGVGLFGLSCGHLVSQLYLIENDLAAMRAARQNGMRLGLHDVVYIPDRVESGLAAVLDCVNPAHAMCLLDPPRSGCSETVLSHLLTSRVGQIVYISCAPDCLARDARRLQEGGYRLVSVTPFDMFPQTAHIEVVSCWEKLP